MSDEKKGAVLTGEEIDRLWNIVGAARELQERDPDAIDDFDLQMGGPEPLIELASAFDPLTAERVVAAARLARLAAELFEEHGQRLAKILDEHYATKSITTGEYAAIQSFINVRAAFRKGAE